jgi:outer membrane lipopolysaccharide assembly protein LptE/RlpB
LRGSQLRNANLDVLNLIFSQPNGNLARNLERNLVATGLNIESQVDISKPIQSRQLTLTVSAEETSIRPVSINPRARAAQYEIRLSIVIRLEAENEIKIESDILSVERTYFEDIENIVGNQEEVQIIISEMRQNLITQVMRRLESSIN